jgi:purine-binding chemotaxis protein CheW
VPGAAPSVLGVTAVRGEIRPVIDLSRLLGLPSSGSAEGSHVLLLRVDAREVGLRVDAVEGVDRSMESLAGTPGGPGDAGPEVREIRLKALTPDLLHVLDAGMLRRRLREQEG